MQSKELVNKWFKKWEEGDYAGLPISDSFKHISPYGIIEGKKKYIALIEDNKDKFLGHRFIIHDGIYGEGKACVRYTAFKDDFKLEASEWYYIKDGLIEEIASYYNIESEISENRKLKNF